MSDKSQLIQDLAALPAADWQDVVAQVEQAREQRNGTSANGTAGHDFDADGDPLPTISKDAYARWIVRGMLAVDSGLREVIYLPANAHPNVVRLMAVNTELPPSESEPLHVRDGTPNNPGISYQILELDVTPEQWERMQRGNHYLPAEWDLRGAVVFDRTHP